MSAEDFSLLAAKALSGEASPEERSRLEKLVAADQECRREWQELQEAWQFVQNTAPMVQALQAESPELPAYRLPALQTTVRENYRRPVNTASSYPAHLFRLATVGGVFMAIFLVAYLCLPQHPPTLVECGYLETELTRGAETPSLWPTAKNLEVKALASDAEFEHWKSASLNADEKARVWIDEESDTLHVRWRNALGQTVEKTTFLPQDFKDRQEAIAKFLSTDLIGSPQ